MSAEKYFVDNLNKLPKGIGGLPQDPEKFNLYQGLLELARQLSRLEKEQAQTQADLQRLRSRLP